MGSLADVLTADCAEMYDPSDIDGFSEALTRSDRLLDAKASAAARGLAERFDADAQSRLFAAHLHRRLLGTEGGS